MGKHFWNKSLTRQTLQRAIDHLRGLDGYQMQQSDIIYPPFFRESFFDKGKRHKCRWIFRNKKSV